LNKQRDFEEKSLRIQAMLKSGQELEMMGKGKGGGIPMKSEKDISWSPRNMKKDDPL
jgi:hypothetical protein